MYTTSQKIADLLSEEGILIVNNIVDLLNNLYSKTVVIQVYYWQDTEKAYRIIKDLKRNGKTEIETREGIYEVKTVEQEKITIDVPEQEIKPDTKCEELDAYLEQMREEDEAIWLRKYDKVSCDDEMNRDESYLYLDLRNFLENEYIE